MMPDFSRFLSDLPKPSLPPFLRGTLGETLGSTLSTTLNQVNTVFANTPLSDVQKSIHAVVKESAQKMNVMTRDEFEVHGKMIERLISQIDLLEARIAQLEQAKGRSE